MATGLLGASATSVGAQDAVDGHGIRLGGVEDGGFLTAGIVVTQDKKYPRR